MLQQITISFVFVMLFIAFTIFGYQIRELLNERSKIEKMRELEEKAEEELQIATQKAKDAADEAQKSALQAQLVLSKATVNPYYWYYTYPYQYYYGRSTLPLYRPRYYHRRHHHHKA